MSPFSTPGTKLLACDLWCRDHEIPSRTLAWAQTLVCLLGYLSNHSWIFTTLNVGPNKIHNYISYSSMSLCFPYPFIYSLLVFQNPTSEDSSQLPIFICFIHCMFMSPCNITPRRASKTQRKGQGLWSWTSGKIFTTTWPLACYKAHWSHGFLCLQGKNKTIN